MASTLPRTLECASVEQVHDGLTVTYHPEGSLGIGQLAVWASVPPFAGAALGYFNDDDLRSFAADISAYPLPDGSRPQVTAGHGGQETVGLKVSQISGRGQLGVEVRLAVIDIDDHSPTTGSVSSVRMLLLTSYQALHDFAAGLLTVVDTQGGTAHLPIDKLT